MSDLPKFEPLPNVGNVVSNNVTAFNQGYNLYQCINYLQGYVSIVYDSMDALLDDWNNFQQVVNENISNIASEETQKVLNQWLEDGTLNDLIAQNPLWNQKLDKSGGTMTGNIKFSENTKIVGTTPGGNDIDLIHNTNDVASGNYVQFGDPDAKTVINSSQQPVWHNGDDDYLLLTQKQLNDGLAGKVNKSGDTMTGNLNLNASLNFTEKITMDTVRDVVSKQDKYTVFGGTSNTTVFLSKGETPYVKLKTGALYPIISGNLIINNLNSDAEQLPLSAKQGKVLNDKFNGIKIKSINNALMVSGTIMLNIQGNAYATLFTGDQIKQMLGLSSYNYQKVVATVTNGNASLLAEKIDGKYMSTDGSLSIALNNSAAGNFAVNYAIIYNLD
nr:MAG TPA: hypothetical protein [Caudoviricetes sp.]